jgi:hypothetical protein
LKSLLFSLKDVATSEKTKVSFVSYRKTEDFFDFFCSHYDFLSSFIYVI